MYVAQELAERIKKLAREQGIGQGELLKKCGCNTNILNQISEEKGIASFSLAKIADELDCSVDYLLCRTENPDSHNTHTGDITISPYEDRQLASIIKIYEQLDDVGKARLLVAADEINRNNRQTQE